jgi:outer membrane protein OmpA-like peptidoglycan-associated protein
MNRILFGALAIVLLVPCVSFSESWEEFQKIKAAGEQQTLIPKGNTKIIPKDVIVEGLKKDCQVAFTSDALLFQYGSASIRKESLQTLKNAAAAIKQAMEDPELSQIATYYVDGHTCNIGSPENNCRLSWMRAEATISELVKLGVPPERLRPRGFGPAYPTHPNDTEATRMLNRRVVLKGDCPNAAALDSQTPCRAQQRLEKSSLVRKGMGSDLKAKGLP